MTTAESPLQLTRLPDEFGPVIRCSGELTAATLEPLRRELDLLVPLEHPVLTISLTGCTFLDSNGILTLFQAFKRRSAAGRRLSVVAGDGTAARLLELVGFDRVVPTFASEGAASLALRGGPPHDVPKSWEVARVESLLHWRLVLEAVDKAPVEEVVRRLTSITGLCRRSDAPFREAARRPAPTGGKRRFTDWKKTLTALRPPGGRSGPTARCEYCPFFAALGGDPDDVGCQGVVDPIIRAMQAGDRGEARSQALSVLSILEAMPLPGEDHSPEDRSTVPVDAKSGNESTV
jgi:anti-anti-sigma factor